MSKSKLAQCLILCGLATALAGCGKDAFVGVNSEKQSEAPGYYTIAPKVDIVLAQDDTGSMYDTITQLNNQIPVFLNDLESAGWNYHFATTPLITAKSFEQMTASKHDRNWGSGSWKPAYPGDDFGFTPPGTIAASLFRKTSEYTDILNIRSLRNTGLQAGFKNILEALRDRTQSTGFMRPDALLVILAVSNGNDTTGVKYCKRADGVTVPCEDANALTPLQCGTPGVSFSNCSPGTLQGAVDQYAPLFQALRPNAALVKFYSVVSVDGSRYEGTQYEHMSTKIGGAIYDIRTQSITTILNSLKDNLQFVRGDYRTVYLVLDQEPDPSTIKITKYINGDPTQASVIPQDSVDGWSYDETAGVQTVYTIDSPAPMNQATGYVIRLNGSARLIGKDKASVSYLPKGTGNAAH